MTLSDLLGDVEEALPRERRQALEAIVNEYGTDDNARLMLALVAASSPRERRLIRLLLTELDIVDAAGDGR